MGHRVHGRDGVTEDPAWLEEARSLAAMPWDDFLTMLESQPSRTRRAMLRARFRFDVIGFATFCFPEICTRPWNDYHRHVLRREKVPWYVRLAERKPNQRDAQAAFRGIAKSTTMQIDDVHDVVYGLEGYTVVVGPGEDEGAEWSSDLRALLAHDGPLRWLYGTITIGSGSESFIVQAPGQDPQRFRFVSSRSKVRGTKFGHIRVTKVQLDDYDDRKRVKNQTLRDEDADFITKDVLKLGAPGGVGTIFQLRGTVHHNESQIARMLRREAPHRGWTSRKWQAVLSWPKRHDLWAACGRIYANLAIRPSPAQLAALEDEHPDLDTDQHFDRHRVNVARVFYEANREAMDDGVELLDPVAHPIFNVFVMIWTEGRASVESELQNNAIDPTTQVFRADAMHRCRLERTPQGQRIIRADGTAVWLRDCRVKLRWDPVPGQSESGDFAAVAIVARCPLGYAFVIYGWIARASATRQLGTVFDAAGMFHEGQPGAIEGKVESNGFASGLVTEYRREMAAREADGRFYRLDLHGKATSKNKEERIGAMEVAVTNGHLQFADTIPVECMAMFEAWRPDGSADHDDFPDAVAAAVEDLGTAGPEIVSDPNRRLV